MSEMQAELRTYSESRGMIKLYQYEMGVGVTNSFAGSELCVPCSVSMVCVYAGALCCIK